jgi:hypothetical protein
MRKSDLHPALRATSVPVPGHSGCFAVVPPPIRLEPLADPTLYPLAEREIHALTEAVRAAPHYEVLSILYRGVDSVLDDVATLRNYRPSGGT